MHDINVAIRTDRLYSASRFADIRLSPSVVSLAEIASTGKRLSEANRLLLEAAYSNEIVRRPVDRVEGKMGSALTVLVALILGGGLYLGLLRVLKVDELDYLWGGLRRRIFKRPGAGGGGPENPAVVEPVAPDEHLE
jgi:hypothetical protein